ncbi:phosphate ABC transporter, inner membrane subunit PstC [Thiorhodococcus drewsii AZ1]|uniref:Phosphate transport system permease protein n=1 Tax=Thiorhodococcus drewsii AZ1 TaxID=765913 RepID=G2E3E5_9GAMM|nr:phosphate ABC transporter permease subunit PstC [Thiorhodococcus drewsii]EGV30334.1 phosphate ABC transporter, inner membrane subunit PstC [Thiorhodococcus drewsii AZ1]
MNAWTLILLLLAVMAAAYNLGRKRAISGAGGIAQIKTLHSLPVYYGLYAALWAGIPALLLLGLWSGFQDQIITALVSSSLPPDIVNGLSEGRIGLLINDIKNLATGNIVSSTVTPEIQAAADQFARLEWIASGAKWLVVLAVAIAGLALALSQTAPKMRARNRVETIVKGIMILFSSIAILTTLGILLSVVFESLRFFHSIPPLDFFLGINWSPQIALRADQVGASGEFGAIPLFTGTLMVSVIAMLVAVPIGLMAAIYLSEYASRKVRAFAKPVIEVLAGIPTVVYGFFAALTVAPFVRELGESVGLHVASESALAAGLVMGVMIIPFVSSLSDDVINAVPQSMRDGSFALGATQSETIRRVIVPAALPGIVGGILLAVSRAIGETMIVVMAAGMSANLTANPLDSVTTVTVQIVTLLTGDQEFDSAKTLAAFALGLTLFMVTLVLNVIALTIVRKYREQYD